MSPGLSVVIIDGDQSSRRTLEAALKEVDKVTLAGMAEDLASGVGLVEREKPGLVIMEIDRNEDKAYRALEEIQRKLPYVTVFATSANASSDGILKAMRAGCAEYLLRPVAQDDLLNSLKKIGRLLVHSTAARQPVAEQGKIITCFSPKGGVGNTTIATNLAVSLHELSKKPVVIVDLDLEGGDVSMFLDLQARYTITDVTSNVCRLDNAFLEGVLAKHSSGVDLLSEPEKVEDAHGITPSQVREVLNQLKAMYTYVVVDTGIGYGDMNLAAFDAADLILLVGIMSLPSIKNIQKSLDVFNRLGYCKDKVRFVVNRYARKGGINLEDAEKTLSCKVFMNLPNDYYGVMASINHGQPLIQMAPGSEISRAFKDMSKSVREYLAKA